LKPNGHLGQDRGRGVDVAVDEVPPQPLAEPQRKLDVDARAEVQAAERRARERFGHNVELDDAGVVLDHGQADAVDGDRILDVDAFGNGRGRFDAQTNAAAGIPPKLRHPPRMGDQATEHRLIPFDATRHEQVVAQPFDTVGTNLGAQARFPFETLNRVHAGCGLE
jgi:hypothetical protein